MTNTPRLDLLIAEHGKTVVLALVVVAALSIVATGWVVANPTTTTTTEEIGEETVSTDLETSAEVVEDGLWEEGTVLENNAAYVIDASPELTLTTTTAVPSDDTRIEHELVLTYEATRDGDVFWEDETTLASDEPTVEDGVAVTEATVDVHEIVDRRAHVEEQLDGISDVDLTITVRTTYETDTHAGELQSTEPFVVTDRTYYLEDRPSASETNPITQAVETTESPSSALVGLLVLLASGAVAGALYVRSRQDIDVAQARQRIHEKRYAEWISRGSLPMWIGDDHVALDTLEDVVDVAIDTNERVIHDRDRGLFAVVSDSVVYYYSDRGLWAETAWPEFNITRRSREERSDDGTEEPGPTTPSNAPQAPQAADAESGEFLFSTESDSLPDPDDEDAWEQL